MKIGKAYQFLIILALISGCAAQSMVVSKRAHVGQIGEGMLYSLPKQLVKVIYTPQENKLEIIAEDPIPDTDHTFYATIDHRNTYSDTIEISTKNGLLHGDLMGHSEDKTGEIVVSLASSAAGMPQPLQFSIQGSIEVPEPSSNQNGCTPNKETLITQVIDPSDSKDINTLSERLKKDACIELTVLESNEATGIQKQNAALQECLQCQNGLIYRQPGIFTFVVKKVSTNSEIGRIRLSLAQGGHIGVLPLPTGFFSKSESDISFSDGRLSKVKIVQPRDQTKPAMRITKLPSPTDHCRKHCWRAQKIPRNPPPC